MIFSIVFLMLSGKLWDFGAAGSIFILKWSWTMDWHTQEQIDDIYAGVQCQFSFDQSTLWVQGPERFFVPFILYCI